MLAHLKKSETRCCHAEKGFPIKAAKQQSPHRCMEIKEVAWAFILSLDIYQRNIWKCDHFYILIVYLTEKYMKVWLLLYWVLISNTKNVWKCFISYREIYEIMTALILSLYILQRNIGKYDCSYIESLYLTLLLYWVFLSTREE